MPINKPCDAYNATKDQVQRVRDCMSQDAVKEAGETYLPRLSGQTLEEYDSYKTRAYLMPVVKESAISLAGSIMRKRPVADIPAKMNYLLDDVDGADTDLSLLVSDGIMELFLAGRHGLLIDPSDTALNILPFKRENIINWSKDYIVIAQTYVELDNKDKFKQHIKTEYLELTYDDNGFYIQNVWRSDGKAFAIVDTIEPTVAGNRLDYLPFVFINTNEASAALTPPALLQLADINLDQYRLSTDLRHGLHWTSLPTGFLFGDLTDNQGLKKQITVGAGSFNHIEDNEARAELLEFTGAGLNAITVTVDADIEAMEGVGLRMRGANSGGVKAAETARIESSGESATLSTIASAYENGVTMALKIVADWMGVSGNISYEINRDFIDERLTPQDITALLQAWQSGGISLNTFLNQLHKGEILPKGVTPEDEEDRIGSGSDFGSEIE